MPDRPLSPSVLQRYADPAYLSSSAQAPEQPPTDGRSLYRKVGLPAVIGGNVADIGTTVQAIHEGRAREANPLMGHGGTAGMVAVKAGTTAAEAVLLDRLAKNHKLAALLASLGIGAAEFGLAARNHGVGRR